MIHLSAYLHREQFQEIVGRWFYNDLQPSDALDVKYIVNFNSILIRRYLRGLAGRLFRDVYRVEPSSFHVHTKGELKDFVADHPTVTNAHIQDMIAAYRERPEDFYKETPIDGRVFYADEGAHTMFLGSARLKRPRRIAEKGGRRISDFVYQRIRDNAEKLARDRAERLRIPLEHLVSSHEQMVQEFAEAEDLIRQTIKTHRQPILEHTFDIHDVAGLKLVGEHDVQEEIVRYIEAAPDLTLLEREEHRGLYNATNLTVEMQSASRWAARTSFSSAAPAARSPPCAMATGPGSWWVGCRWCSRPWSWWRAASSAMAMPTCSAPWCRTW